MRSCLVSLMLLASSLGSTLVASTATAQPCEKPKLLVLCDISGSMLAGSPSKYRQAIDGLDAALATLEGRADFGLMLFPKPQKYGNPYGRCNTTTQMEIPFTSFARSTFYNHLNPSGSSYFGGPAGSYDTPISHAFTDVATMTAFSSPSSATYIVLISDGIMDCYPGGPPRDFLTRDWYLSDGYTPNATASGENREAINNIVKHAEASNVEIRLQFSDQALVLEISDDGRGIAEPRRQTPADGGLAHLRDRADRLRARLDILPRPTGGTSILLTVPYP